MHTQFTSYHTAAFVIITTIILFILAKLTNADAKSMLTTIVLLQILAIAAIITGCSLFYKYHYRSGMNRMTVSGFPRGFYHIITEPSGLQKKMVIYRYAAENILVWFSLCTLLYFIFKSFILTRK